MSSSDGHAPGVIPGVPVLSSYLAAALWPDDHGLLCLDMFDLLELDAEGLIRPCADGSGNMEPSALGRRALAAHRLGIATRASFTIRTTP